MDGSVPGLLYLTRPVYAWGLQGKGSYAQGLLTEQSGIVRPPLPNAPLHSGPLGD